MAAGPSYGGGVKTDEVMDTMESHRIPGLYLCGELLDVDGICGGFICMGLEFRAQSGRMRCKKSAGKRRKKINVENF